VVQDARLDSGPPRGADSVKLPIQKATVRWLLAWRPTTLAAHRSRLLTVVATLGCMRVNLNEVARLQVCDLWVDYLMSCGVSGFEGTCSVHINRRKNDTQRKGHYPAFGRSWARDSDPGPELDVVTVAIGCRSPARGSRCTRAAVRSGRGQRLSASSARRCSRSRAAQSAGSQSPRRSTTFKPELPVTIMIRVGT
jgi:hypothetical protein